MRETIDIRATEEIEGKASPRNPKKLMLNKLSSGSFDVACRSTAIGNSSLSIPLPLSETTIRLLPPSDKVTSTDVAPASIEFSTNSLTTEAGRSITSPAAIWLTRLFGKILIVILFVSYFRKRLINSINEPVEASCLFSEELFCNSGKILKAICLPSSTPYWSKELIFQTTP